MYFRYARFFNWRNGCILAMITSLILLTVLLSSSSFEQKFKGTLSLSEDQSKNMKMLQIRFFSRDLGRKGEDCLRGGTTSHFIWANFIGTIVDSADLIRRMTTRARRRRNHLCLEEKRNSALNLWFLAC